MAEEGEKEGEGRRVEQGHSETLLLTRKQEFRMVSDLFQHAANVWRKIFLIHYCCSGAVVAGKHEGYRDHGELREMEH